MKLESTTKVSPAASGVVVLDPIAKAGAALQITGVRVGTVIPGSTFQLILVMPPEKPEKDERRTRRVVVSFQPEKVPDGAYPVIKPIAVKATESLEAILFIPRSKSDAKGFEFGFEVDAE